ncbi:MAG: TIGR03013 family PEP-CTERM/XrtA system glycosyltransferase [Spongiibacteraceae bacterium]
MLVLLEYVAMFAAVYAAHSLRFNFWGGVEAVDMTAIQSRAHIYACVNLVCMIAMGAYRPHNPEGLTGSLLRSMVAIFLIGTAALSIAFYLFPSFALYFGRGVLAIASVISLFAISLLRYATRLLVGNEVLRWRVLVVGTGERAQRVLDALTKLKAQEDVAIVGCWPVNSSEPKVSVDRMISSPEALLEFCRRQKIQEIVVAVDERRRSDQNSFPLDELLDCKLDGIVVIDDLTFLERESGQLDIRTLSPGWLVFSDGFSFSWMRDFLERGFDVVASTLLLLVTWPFMVLTVLAIKLEEGLRAPIIYSQERVGFGGKVFRVHKFRSMRIDAEKDGKAQWAKKNDSRVTRVGSFIRNTRIDELPQIFNVLKGEMSFVGPRPERPQFVEELAQQIPYYRERHRVKPGITGWAQLCYPYGASVQDAEQKLTYDLYYIKNHSLIFDLYILVRTVEVILLGSGVR